MSAALYAPAARDFAMTVLLDRFCTRWRSSLPKTTATAFMRAEDAAHCFRSEGSRGAMQVPPRLASTAPPTVIGGERARAGGRGRGGYDASTSPPIVIGGEHLRRFLPTVPACPLPRSRRP